MEKKKILVTGGAGYIGGHAIVDLVESGFEVVSIDDLSRGSRMMLDGIASITGRPVRNYEIDLCDLEKTRRVFEEHPDIVGIVHFAAYKSVPESVRDPLRYFANNIQSLVNVLKLARENDIRHFVFSSSCSVYGTAKELPVLETTPFGQAESPYARTKQIGEDICRDMCRTYPEFRATLLRYFNPAGAHSSGLIGECQKAPENIVPIITETAAGLRPELKIFGSDYPTRDGSCLRDYVHVADIARAHTKALQHSMREAAASNCEVFNLGTGAGVSVLELIRAFEKVSGKKLASVLAPRRAGDIAAIYADTSKARAELGWEPVHTLEDMMAGAWQWQMRLLQ